VIDSAIVTEGASANLDLLRTIAVVLVLLQHLFFKLPFHWMQFVAGQSPGLFGVLLFFVHTSLVLMFSMQRSRLKGPALFKNFYVRRIFRIYPLALIAVLAVMLLHLDSDVNGVHGLVYHRVPLTARTVVGESLLVQNVVGIKSNPNVLWSLPYELQMYVVLPFLFLWTRSRSSFLKLIGLWCLSVVAAWAQPQFHVLPQSYGISLFSLLRFVPCFLPGIIAFTLLPRAGRLASWLWPLFILALLVIFLQFPILPVAYPLCLVLGLTFPMFREIQSRWVRVVSSRVATYSYGIYICHPFCLWICFEVLKPASPWIKAAVLLASLVLFPWTAYHCVEKPLIEAGKKIAGRWTQAAKPVYAAVS
jgi:peptidoglycan/LPS O-acetylase OafA/YrhL